MARSPYAGRRPATASAPRVDAARLAARYRQVTCIAQCAREFGISWHAARGILVRAGVQVQAARRGAADERAVLRAYDRMGSIFAVVTLHGVAEAEVRAILDRHGVPHDRPGPLPDLTSTARRRKAAPARSQQDPAPAVRAGRARGEAP